MTFDDILHEFNSIPIHNFSNNIKKGEYPFPLLEKLSKAKTLPPLLIISLLSHPDCTEEYFMAKADNLFKTTGTVARQSVLRVTKLVASLKIIAFVVYAKEDTVESIMDRIEMRNETFKIIAENPNCHPDFKIAMYQHTGDASLLPQSAQDIFVF